MTSAPQLPNYLGLPFRILVSPFVNFDPENRMTDIMMFNSRNLGALIVDEDPHVKSWEDSQCNIQNMSIEETYGFGNRIVYFQKPVTAASIQRFASPNHTPNPFDPGA